MNIEEIKEAVARFLFVLATMLVAMTIYYGIESMMVSRPVIVAINPPFKVNTKVVKPGEAISYDIHFYKRLDIPGDLYKQLIIKDKKTGKESYLPLEAHAGHLPPGDVQKTAYAHIPAWAPEGIGRIKLSSSHHTGNIRQNYVVYTEKFEVVK